MNELPRILFVDDERNIREIYALHLSELGYPVATAANAAAACSLLGERQFEIVFVDQYLGADRGLDLIRGIARPDSAPSFVMITANGSTDLAVEALKSGAADFISKPFSVPDLVKSIDYVRKKQELDRERRGFVVKLQRTVEEKTRELDAVHVAVLSSLAQTVEKRDLGTYGHSRRVSYYARLIASALDLSEEQRKDLKTAAVLHDIGKIGITDFVLGKQGPLTAAERSLVEEHPRKGCEILEPLKSLGAILPAIRHHHEHFDGTGYPDRLAGERIPFLARLIAVADTYDAITSTRPYRAAASHALAVGELQACSGRQFDPNIVEAFVRTDNRFRMLFGEKPFAPAGNPEVFPPRGPG